MMGEFTNKIDFAVLAMVKDANPNGDPLNGNRPRETYDGYGEISDVCIKRKIRNRLRIWERKFLSRATSAQMMATRALPNVQRATR